MSIHQVIEWKNLKNIVCALEMLTQLMEYYTFILYITLLFYVVYICDGFLVHVTL